MTKNHRKNISFPQPFKYSRRTTCI